MGRTTINGTQITDASVSLTVDVTGVLPVANGGSAANTLTGILKGNGTSAFTAVTAPSGAIVGDTDTQTLTAKSIALSSNTITGTKAQFNTAVTDGDIVYVGDVVNIAVPVTSKTANYTALTSDQVILVDATSAAITITLPAASGASGTRFDIKKIDSSGNLVIIDANASETIDGSLTLEIVNQYDSVTIVSNGTSWFII